MKYNTSELFMKRIKVSYFEKKRGYNSTYRTPIKYTYTYERLREQYKIKVVAKLNDSFI